MINLEKEIREQPSALLRTESTNRERVALLCADFIKRKLKNITFAARGTSDHASIYGQYIIGTTAGIPCGLATPSVVSKYGASIDYGDHLVIGVSQSGMAEDVIGILNDAKRYGALTAAITNNESSPLAKTADFSLFCDVGPETSIAATKTFTSQLYIIAMIASCLSGDEALAESLKTVPSKLSELLSVMPGKLDGFIGKYKNTSYAAIIGRGFLYPIALEGALKILETNKMKTRGYATSDFHHGPKAQIGEGDLVFVLACKSSTLDDEKEIAKELCDAGGDVIVITDTDESFGNARVLRVPDGGLYKYPDAISAFMCAVTFQLTALKLTEVKGIDPDASKVLKKVTVTF